jgi:3-oxoacyl-(acyl-carrier-protein) synthase
MNSCGVVITGMGSICCAGRGVDSLWRAVSESRPPTNRVCVDLLSEAGVGPEVSFAQAATPMTMGDLATLRKPLPSRLTLLALDAAQQALQACGVSLPDQGNHFGAAISTEFGPNRVADRFLTQLQDTGVKAASPLTFSRATANAILGDLTRQWGLTGPSSLLLGDSAVLHCQDLIAAGHTRAMLCGGTDEIMPVHLFMLAENSVHFGGFAGEGAFFVTLESESQRVSTGRGYASILGSGRSRQAAGFGLNFGSLRASIEQALSCTDLSERILGYIPVSETLEGTVAELEAVADLFGACNTSVVPVKPAIGSTFGGSEVANLIVAITWLNSTRILKPSSYSTRQSTPLVLTNSLSFGGNLVSLLVGAACH